MLVAKCHWLNYHALKQQQQNSNFGTSSAFLSWSASFFCAS